MTSPTEWPQRHALVDAAAIVVCAALAVATLVTDIEGTTGTVQTLDFALAIGGSLALLPRRRHPLLVVLVVIGFRLGLTTSSASELALVPATSVALYTAAKHGSRSWSLVLGIAFAVMSTVVIVQLNEEQSAVAELFGELSTILLPVALGDAVRSREGRVAAIVDAEAERRVQTERLRIARDLHDIVAHALAAISIQSGVAAFNHQSQQPNDPVRLALERINDIGRTSLEDLRAMVGVLRSTDSVALAPTPTDPDDLSDIEQTAAITGIHLTIEVDGSFPADVSDACVVAMHRIATEALTNVARHAGSAPTNLRLEHAAEQTVLRVANTTAHSAKEPIPSTGVGILGMRERAESLGGSLSVDRINGGGFSVRAVLPHHPPTS